ncbi:condensation domain-containing protein [Nonomuraea sp. NPDC001023]
MMTAYELAGGIDTERLADALDLVISRHEPLRMRLLKQDDGSLRQEFRDTGQPARPEVHVVESIDTALADFQLQHPDIYKDGPVRSAFFRDEEAGRTAFALHIDHMAIDGWGLELLISELTQAYAALCSGVQPELPGLRISFTDHVGLECEAGETVTDAQVRYWSDLLLDSSPYELPTELARTGAKEAVAATIARAVSAETTTRLLELSRKLRVPMPALAIASIGVTAMARSGVTDMLVKNVHLGRDVPGSMRLVGCFTRTSFVKLGLDRDLPVERLIRNAARGWLDSVTYSAAPFTLGRLFRHLLGTGAMDFETMMRLARALTVNYFASPERPSRDDPVLGTRIPVPTQSAYSVGNDVMPLLIEVRVGEQVNIGSICNPERYQKDGVATFLDGVTAGLAAIAASDPSGSTGTVADAIASSGGEG